MNEWNDKCLPRPSQAMTIDKLHTIVGQQCESTVELIRQTREDTTERVFQLQRDMSALLQRQKEDILKRADRNYAFLNNEAQFMRDRVEDQQKVISELEDLVSEQRKMIDEQREMMQVMWNAPGMPGGQEAIEKAKESAAVFFAGE